MNIQTFAEVIKLREGFAQNREKAKFDFSNHSFDRREKMMDKNFSNKKEFLKEEDKYHEKRHSRKLKELKISRK